MPENGLLRVLTPDQVTEQKNKKEAELGSILLGNQKEDFQTNLAAYIRKCWEEAKKAKRDVLEQILKNKRQIEGKYEPDVLATLQAANVPIYFMMLTFAKCRSAVSWLKEAICQPGNKIWDIEPTPQPQLPPDAEKAVQEKFFSNIFSLVASKIAMQGQEVNPFAIIEAIRPIIVDFEKDREAILKKEAKKRCDRIREKLDDVLTEGSFYDALQDFLVDVVLKTGFLKGPVKRKVPSIKVKLVDGRGKPEPVDEMIDVFERRSPFNIYPQPGSVDINDGYLIDHIRMRPKELRALKGVPGFKDSEIDAVLEKYREGGLREWLDYEAEKREILEEEEGSFHSLDERIDCLEFWGTVQGKMLLNWGYEGEEKIEELEEYDIVAWLIGEHVIGAMLNPDLLKRKPFYKVSYAEEQDAFWGKGLPEIIEAVQRACNACARAIIHNVGIASGPQVEIDKDRLAPGEEAQVRPWRVWLTTNDQFQNRPAITFYAPPMVVERLIGVYKFFSNLADEYCGIPGYAHGETQIGGAGNTASGLSMLITQSSRGIKALVQDIDRKVIVPAVENEYYNVIQEIENLDIIPDFKIVAKGAMALLAKEQMAIRRIEFLQMTNNPQDIQIMGVDGRRYLLKTAAKALDLEPEEVVPKKEELEGMAVQPIASQRKPQTLGPGGEPVVGTDFRQFNPYGMNAG
uniref:Portal protein n=1 Tax=candidate division WOR-3 bacterium TaxID=2052148 RepID=A0A7V3KP10_UNCW3